MGDGPVLAEDTPEIAIGEEDGPGPVSTHQRDFLAKMRMSPKDDGSQRTPAEPLLTLFPVHPALPGTEVAILEDVVGFLDLLGKLPLILQLRIRWAPCFSLFRSIQGSGIEKQRATKEESIFDEIPTGSFHGETSMGPRATRPFPHEQYGMLA